MHGAVTLGRTSGVCGPLSGCHVVLVDLAVCNGRREQ
jgi:hypothetical protein